jgi:hypothetical protein
VRFNFEESTLLILVEWLELRFNGKRRKTIPEDMGLLRMRDEKRY